MAGKPRKQETGLSLTPTSTPNSRLSYVASQSPEFPAKKWDGDGSKSKGCVHELLPSQAGELRDKPHTV